MTVTSISVAAIFDVVSLGTAPFADFQIEPLDPNYYYSGPTLHFTYTRTPGTRVVVSDSILSTDSLGIYNFGRLVDNIRGGGSVVFGINSSGGTPDVLRLYELYVQLNIDGGQPEKYRPGAITVHPSYALASSGFQLFGAPPQLADDLESSGVDFINNLVVYGIAPLVPVVVVQPVLRQIHRRDGLGQASVGRLTPGCNSVTRVIGGQP